MMDSFFVDQSQEKTGPSLPHQLLTKGIGTIMHMARHTYSGPASSSFNDGNNSNDNDRSHSGSETILPLKCSLMSISLPWDTIAHDLLFKVSLTFLLLEMCLLPKQRLNSWVELESFRFFWGGGAEM